MLTPRCPKCHKGELYFSSSLGRWKCESCDYLGGKTLIGNDKRVVKMEGTVRSNGPREVVKAMAKKQAKYKIHKAYSYKNKKGKMVHVASHKEKVHR